jgi:hypothetical protein
MSWIDRINHAISRRTSGKAVLLAGEHGIEQAGQRYPYADLQRAVALRQPSVIGDALSVALEFGEGHVVVVSDTDAAWKPVLASLDEHPRILRPSAEWSLALVAGAADARFGLLTSFS